MIRFVVFDLWKTLASRTCGYSTRRVVEEFGIDIPFDRVVKIFEESVQTKKWRSKHRAYENFCRNMGIGIDSKTVNRVIEIRDYSEASTRPLPHTMKMLKCLREAGYKTGLLSNSSVFAADVLKRKTRILDYIDYPVFSFEVGTVKPDLRIFRRILEISGFRPEETVMVGDKPVDDVRPARRAGMNAILFTDYEQLKRELEGLGVVF
jgi:putative hydrolase of the HAD superfamily